MAGCVDDTQAFHGGDAWLTGTFWTSLVEAGHIAWDL